MLALSVGFLTFGVVVAALARMLAVLIDIVVAALAGMLSISVGFLTVEVVVSCFAGLLFSTCLCCCIFLIELQKERHGDKTVLCSECFNLLDLLIGVIGRIIAQLIEFFLVAVTVLAVDLFINLAADLIIDHEDHSRTVDNAL